MLGVDILTKKIRNNPNGNLTELQLLQIMYSGAMDNYIRKHNLVKDKCPPYKLISSDTQCTYCVTCWNDVLSQIKELKDCYKIVNKKYMKENILKEELDE